MIAAAEARQREDLSCNANVLAMLANCHRLGMDRYDAQGHRHAGPHPKLWTADEFLPRAWRSPGRRDRRDVIPGTIECLKIFLPPGAQPVEMPRSSFHVAEEA